jgi:SpoIID/LytB domain protein
VAFWVLATLAIAGHPAQAADDLSGADKLRALYSAEFRFTHDGIPIIPVAVADGLDEVTITGPRGLVVQPQGEGGPEIRADGAWRLRAEGARPARLRHWAIVWRGRPGQGRQANAEAERWKNLGENPRQFEQGTLFAVAGQVLDRRETLVAVGPMSSFEEADAAQARLRKKVAPAPLAEQGVYTELVERPHGVLEAVGAATGARVRNEGVIWFAGVDDTALRVDGKGRGVQGEVVFSGSYFGRLYVTLDRGGRIAVVNALSSERLLAGLVPAEIFSRAPTEALKAQAIAARGHLLTKIGRRHMGDPFRLCSRTHCQVYSGAGKENPRTTQAVDATRGELLFTEDGSDLVDTVYSANCGGHGEDNEKVWPDMSAGPQLRGRFDSLGEAPSARPGSSEEIFRAFLLNPPRSYDQVATIGSEDRFRWKVTLSAAEVTRMIEPLGVGQLRALRVVSRGASGRALAIELEGSRGRARIDGELRIRRTFGGLRSSMFIAEVVAGAVTFTGGGFGHGVGLCQTGSIGMSEAGKTYREILRKYYPGSTLKKLW